MVSVGRKEVVLSRFFQKMCCLCVPCIINLNVQVQKSSLLCCGLYVEVFKRGLNFIWFRKKNIQQFFVSFHDDYSQFYFKLGKLQFHAGKRNLSSCGKHLMFETKKGNYYQSIIEGYFIRLWMQKAGGWEEQKKQTCTQFALKFYWYTYSTC